VNGGGRRTGPIASSLAVLHTWTQRLILNPHS
jgi:hypothetical protein